MEFYSLQYRRFANTAEAGDYYHFPLPYPAFQREEITGTSEEAVTQFAGHLFIQAI